MRLALMRKLVRTGCDCGERRKADGQRSLGGVKSRRVVGGVAALGFFRMLEPRSFVFNRLLGSFDENTF